MAKATSTPLPRLAEMYFDSFMLHTVAPSYVDCKHQATNKSSKMLRMKTSDEIRYENLTKLLNDFGGGDLSMMLKKSKSWLIEDSDNRLSRPTLDQILKRRTTAAGTTKNIGDDLARKIEDEFKLERGWMDNEHQDVTGAISRSAFEPSSTSEYPSPSQIGVLVSLFIQATPELRDQLLDSAREAVEGDGGVVRRGAENQP